MKRSILSIALPSLLLGLTLPLSAMPPQPDLLERIRSGQQPQPYRLQHAQALRAAGLDRAYQVGSTGELDETTVTPLLLMIEFTDTSGSVARASMDSLLYARSSASLADYLSEISYGEMTLSQQDTSHGWYTADNDIAFYANAEQGLGAYPNNAQKLAEEAVLAADDSVDYSLYDHDGDGEVDYLYIVHAGTGGEFSGSDEDIWSHSWTLDSPQVLDGVSISHYVMVPEYWINPGDMTIAALARHTAIGWLGATVLDDPDETTNGVGDWSLLASGVWNGTRGSSPAHPDAFNRIRMGLASATEVTYNLSDESIEAVQNTPDIYKLWHAGDYSGPQYYLVENRAQSGYDATLPGAGLLIYHVDDTVSTGNDLPWYEPDSTDGGHYLVALEQADGNYDLEMGTNEGDDGDVWPGSTTHTVFDSSSSPSALGYSPAPGDTLVQIKDISSAGATMTADLFVVRYFEGPYNFSGSLDQATGAVSLDWGWGSPWQLERDTLVFDDGAPGSTFNFNANYTHAVRMTPDTSCLLVAVQYYSTGPSFSARVYDWDTDNNRPSTTALFNESTPVASEGWVTVDVESADLVFDDQFVVGWGYENNIAELGFDGTGNGRAWDFNSTSWSAWTETYFIRAVVRYPNGYVATLAPDGSNRELDEITHFNLYRNGQVIATPDTNTTSYVDTIGYGFFTYTVTAQHDEGESSPAGPLTFSYNTNRPPEPFALAAPGNGNVLYENNAVALSWLSTYDPEGNAFDYRVEWALEPSFATAQTATVTDTLLVITDATQLLRRPDDPRRYVNGEPVGPAPEELDELPDESDVYWRVRAVDEHGAVRWALPGQGGWSFLVSVPDTPLVFELVEPVDGAVVDSLATLFRWNSSVDPDPADTLYYRLEVSPVASFPADSTFSVSVADTFATLPLLADDGLYHWRVKAIDSNTAGRYSASSRSFTTDLPQPPSAFTLIGPPDGTELGINDDYRLNASWQPSIDPDPADTVRYEIVATMTLPSGNDSTARYSVGEATGASVSLVELFDLGLWDGQLQAQWWVVASSAGDSVLSSDSLAVTLLERLVDVEEGSVLPREYAISALFPNPFNPTLTAVISLPERAELRLELFNVLGQQVALLHSGVREAGYHSFQFNGADQASGIYFLHASVPGQMQALRKVVLVK